MNRAKMWGLLRLSLAIVFISCGMSLMAQPPMDELMGPGGPGGPGGSNTVSGPPTVSDKGAIGIQALIYGDTYSILRIDFTKIDYEMIDKFMNDFIHNAIGSVVNKDKYLVKLREKQKEDIKNGISNMLKKLRVEIENSMWKNGIGEMYYIVYGNSSEYTTCLVYPSDGLSDSEKNGLINEIDKRYSPVTTFERFGFIIAVTSDSVANKAIEKEEEVHLLKQKGQGNQGQNMMAASNKSATASNEEEDDEDADVETDPVKLRRQLIVPKIHDRFMNPSDKKNEMVTEALLTTRGSAITFVIKDEAAFLESISNFKKNGLDMPDIGIKNVITTNKGSFKWATFNVSLVDSPSFIFLMNFKDTKSASDMNNAFTEAIAGMQSGINTSIEASLKKMNLPFVSNPFAVMLGTFFKEIKPKYSGNQLAIQFNFSTLKKNAAMFIPIFGGVPSKPPKKGGDKEFDWQEDEENSAPANGDKKAMTKSDDKEAPANNKAEDKKASKPEDKPNAKPEDKPNAKPEDKPNAKPEDKPTKKNDNTDEDPFA